MGKKKDLLIKGQDYYLDANGNKVFTGDYHLNRGYCCQSGCTHCPYGFTQKADPSVPAELQTDLWGHPEIEIYPEDVD